MVQSVGGPGADDYLTRESLTNPWKKIEINVRPFGSRLKGEDIVRTVEFTIRSSQKYAMASALSIRAASPSYQPSM